MSPWMNRRLSDLSDAVQIARGVPTTRTVPKGEVPVRSVASLIGDKEVNAFVANDDIQDVRALIGQAGDVLVAIEGGSVGDSFFVTAATPLFVPSQQAVTIRVVDDAVLLPQYLAAWLSSPSGRQQLLRVARGGGIQRIPLADLEALPIPIPPLDVQTAIGQRLTEFSAAITGHQRVLDNLIALREIELARLFQDRSLADPQQVRLKASNKSRRRTVQLADHFWDPERLAQEAEGDG
jgi:restriction endonuclease S subunit